MPTSRLLIRRGELGRRTDATQLSPHFRIARDLICDTGRNVFRNIPGAIVLGPTFRLEPEPPDLGSEFTHWSM